MPEQTYTALTSASGSTISPPTYTKLPDTSPFTLVRLLRQKDEAKVYCAIVELYGALKRRLGTHCANKRAQYFHVTQRCVLEDLQKGKNLSYPTVKIQNTTLAAGDSALNTKHHEVPDGGDCPAGYP